MCHLRVAARRQKSTYWSSDQNFRRAFEQMHQMLRPYIRANKDFITFLIIQSICVNIDKHVTKMRKQSLPQCNAVKSIQPEQSVLSSPSSVSSSEQQQPSQRPVTSQSAAPCQQAKPPQPRTHLDRIPIAGLHNYLYADGRKERIFWAIVLIFSGAVTLTYIIPTMMTFLQFTTVLDVQLVTEADVQMPTIQVCVSGSLNRTYLEKIISKYIPQLEKDERLIKLARSYKCSVAELIWWTYGYITLNPFVQSEQLKGLMQAFNEVIYKMVAAFGSDWPGYKAFYDGVMLPCDALLHKCMFNNQKVSCCPTNDNRVMVTNDVCYKLEVKICLNLQ